MRVIDANIILRYLTNDVPEQASAAEALLKRVEEGAEQVLLPDIILADIIWILEGYYKCSREQIRSWMYTLLIMEGLEFSDKSIAMDALDMFATSKIDWSDVFTASQMKEHGIREIYSFDKHFNRIEGIIRVEP